jgi:hypothetical protein
LLAAESNYFHKRLEGWDLDPWTITRADGRPLLVVGVEEHLLEAAEDVIQLMYEGVVPTKLKPSQLAKAGDGCSRNRVRLHLVAVVGSW